MATLEVVIQAAGPLTRGQLEGLGARARQVQPQVTTLSHPLAAAAVEPPVVVA